MAQSMTEAAGLRGLPRLSWTAVIAGTLLALAAHIVLGLLGATLGLAAEPADSEGMGAGAAIWALLTPFVASLLGAWLATRMAGYWDTAGSNVHGVLVWCLGLVLGALFLTGTMATGAMTAGTAASGNAGALQRLTGAPRADVTGPTAGARGEAAADEAGRRAAAATGGAAMATIAGLLGALCGAALGRRRATGKGLGFRIAIQRGADRAREAGAYATRREEREYGRAEQGARVYEADRPYGGTTTHAEEQRPYPGGGMGSMRPEETTRDVTRSEGPGAPPPADPYHH